MFLIIESGTIGGFTSIYGQRGQNNHTVFVNDEDDVNTWEPETYFDTTSELLDRKYNRLSEKQLEEQEFVTSLADESELSKMKKRREERYKNLAEALDDQETIDRVLSHIELRKNLSGKGKRIKVKEGENGHADIYRWRFERKK